MPSPLFIIYPFQPYCSASSIFLGKYPPPPSKLELQWLLFWLGNMWPPPEHCLPCAVERPLQNGNGWCQPPTFTASSSFMISTSNMYCSQSVQQFQDKTISFAWAKRWANWTSSTSRPITKRYCRCSSPTITWEIRPADRPIQNKGDKWWIAKLNWIYKGRGLESSHCSLHHANLVIAHSCRNIRWAQLEK